LTALDAGNATCPESNTAVEVKVRFNDEQDYTYSCTFLPSYTYKKGGTEREGETEAERGGNRGREEETEIKKANQEVGKEKQREGRGNKERERET
jgi:hypothetical protein